MPYELVQLLQYTFGNKKSASNRRKKTSLENPTIFCSYFFTKEKLQDHKNGRMTPEGNLSFLEWSILWRNAISYES